MTPIFEKEYGKSYLEGGNQSSYHYRYEMRLQKYPNHGGGDFDVVKVWSGLTLQQMVKYDWHFRRYACFQQIQNPKNKYFFVVNRIPTPLEAKQAEIKSVKNKLTAAKAKVTEITNKIEVAKAAWGKLFPIEEEPNYQKAMSKLFTKKQLVIKLENELENLTKS